MYFLKNRPSMPESINALKNAEVSRRFFLKSVTAGGGLMLGCASLPALAIKPSGPRASVTDEQLSFSAFVKISPDSRVTVVVKHLDMGQGVSTGLTTLVAEELDASWEQMAWEPSPADGSIYNNTLWGPSQGTGGSTAIPNSWEQLRKAGAAARAMLVEAAAQAWKVPAEEIQVKNGVISHGRKRASFGDMTPRAALLPVPENPNLKDPKDFTLIGKKIPRIDSPEKTNGSAVYTQDIQLPGMLTALVIFPPKLLGKPKKFDAAKAEALPGVVAVVKIPRGVAVVARDFWTAHKARQLVEVEWDLSACETRSSDQLFADFRNTARQTGKTIRTQGDVAAALEAGAKRVDVEFELPFLSHATIEPMNCVAQVNPDGVELWYAAQLHTGDQSQVAAATGLRVDQVRINTLYAGGSFGRRACPDDYVLDAVEIAKQLPGIPVKMVWTREDDLRGGRYRPMSVHRINGAVSEDGKLLAWDHHAVAVPIFRNSPFIPLAADQVDWTLFEGINDMPYTIPNLQIQATEMTVAVPTLWWRAVGHSGHGYVVEAFVDLLAKAAGKDPLVFRQQMLGEEHPRFLGALNLAAEKAGWGTPLPKGRGRGIAVHKAMGSWCAQVAEVTVAEDGSFKVDRVVCAIDCGLAVNPDVIAAQMEGSIGFGLSAALGEAVTLKDGQVEQSNFHNYQLLRIGEMPKVEVHIVPSAEAPSGVGEPGVPPVAGAVANALFAATGKMPMRMPFGRKV